MNTATDPALLDALALDAAIAGACRRIAPTWPLDQLIAVNPWWGWRDLPIAEAARQLRQLTGARLLPSASLHAHWWRRGAYTREDIEAALRERGSALTVPQVLAWMDAPDDAPGSLPLVTDLADRHRDLHHAMAWQAFVTHQVSQQCAAYFDRHQASWRPATDAGLYASWHAFTRDDPGPRVLMGDAGVRQRLRDLPATADGVLHAALPALGFSLRDTAAVQAYATALLGSIGGWAAWAAHLGFQAQLRGGDDPHLRELLAIRLAWEWVLQPLGEPDAAWTIAWGHDGAPLPEQAWVLQDALERAMHRPLARRLHRPAAPVAAADEADVLAVFCIDVRSEPFRRALEAASPRVRTSGFAGFFGLPIGYTPVGAEEPRPQLPGLLLPQRAARDEHDDLALGQQLARQRRRRTAWSQAWDAFRSAPGSAFTFVETCGWSASAALLRKSFGGSAAPAPVTGLRPRLETVPGRDAAQELASRADLVAGVLRAMGLAHARMQWPSLVLLAGHGARATNNPFAAGLQCGACGGQTGEVNARVLAGLLNAPDLRKALAGRGIAIPDATWFVAGLHCTTTDEVELHDTDTAPAHCRPLLQELQGWLASAGEAARAGRAASLGLGAADGPGHLVRQLRRRGADWAQPRPEWALANNMAFIAAPRARTASLDLQGRAFLHEYDWRRDDGYAVLELLMTAPMVVANWINLQYHASCVDPIRYGSGNKVLHNVVGGRLGVFEGNGGDLRIGLPLQSVHDGERWMHAPLRLAVYIEAPREAIDAVLQRHDTVRHLVEHGWLHLYCLDPAAPAPLRRDGATWVDAG